MNMTSPALIALRSTGSAWNGMRRASRPASHLAVEIVTQAGTGHQADLQLLVLGTVDQRKGYGLGFARAGEAAHANGHAVANKEAASWALMTLFCREDKRMRSEYI